MFQECKMKTHYAVLILIARLHSYPHTLYHKSLQTHSRLLQFYLNLSICMLLSYIMSSHGFGEMKPLTRVRECGSPTLDSLPVSSIEFNFNFLVSPSAEQASGGTPRLIFTRLVYILFFYFFYFFFVIYFHTLASSPVPSHSTLGTWIGLREWRPYWVLD